MHQQMTRFSYVESQTPDVCGTSMLNDALYLLTAKEGLCTLEIQLEGAAEAREFSITTVPSGHETE